MGYQLESASETTSSSTCPARRQHEPKHPAPLTVTLRLLKHLYKAFTTTEQDPNDLFPL